MKTQTQIRIEMTCNSEIKVTHDNELKSIDIMIKDLDDPTAACVVLTDRECDTFIQALHLVRAAMRSSIQDQAEEASADV